MPVLPAVTPRRGSPIWCAWLYVLAFIIGVKIWITNDVHKSFSQDPLDQWTAIGVMTLILVEANKERERL